MTRASTIWTSVTRLPLVALVTIGLLLSMLHCAGCGVMPAGSHDVTVSVADSSSHDPDMPEQLLPCHAGHCLSHVTAERLDAAGVPSAREPRRLVIAGDAIPATRDGLPLFKPPRA